MQLRYSFLGIVLYVGIDLEASAAYTKSKEIKNVKVKWSAVEFFKPDVVGFKILYC